MAKKRNRNIDYQISGGYANDLISSIERLVNNKPIDENEAIIFEEILSLELALESINISETTALHKVLYEIAYNELYIFLYDDIDWIENIFQFSEYVIEMFEEMKLEVPSEFYSKNENDIYEAREKYGDYFISGLKVFVDSAFAYLWFRKDLLLKFNLKLSEKISILKKKDYPNLYKDGQIKRATYFPKWIVNLLLNREQGLCHYCNKPVASTSYANQEYDIDHVIPIAQGGTNDPTNLVLSCPKCNNAKKAKITPVPDTFSWPNRDV